MRPSSVFVLFHSRKWHFATVLTVRCVKEYVYLAWIHIAWARVTKIILQCRAEVSTMMFILWYTWRPSVNGSLAVCLWLEAGTSFHSESSNSLRNPHHISRLVLAFLRLRVLAYIYEAGRWVEVNVPSKVSKCTVPPEHLSSEIAFSRTSKNPN